MNDPVIRRSKNTTDNWQTPPWLAQKVTQFGKKLGTEGITLDPATVKENPVGADRIRTPDCDPDGLNTDWWYVAGDDSLIYVNPPYRSAWYKKIEHEAQHLRWGQHMIALLPGKVGTNWFQDLVKYAQSVAFIRGRLTFVGAPDPAPFESALLYFGTNPRAFRMHFENLGWVV